MRLFSERVRRLVAILSTAFSRSKKVVRHGIAKTHMSGGDRNRRGLDMKHRRWGLEIPCVFIYQVEPMAFSGFVSIRFLYPLVADL